MTRRRIAFSTLVVGLLLIAAAVVMLLTGHNDSASPTVAERQPYVALGDSVAAGIGLTTDSDSSACNRTDESYPAQLASLQNYQLTNLACSGATINAGISGPQIVNRLSVPAQVTALPTQKPALLTLTVGANDIGWTEFIGRCYTTICGTAGDDALVSQRLATVGPAVEKALAAISDHYAGKPPRLLVVGYYQVFPSVPTENCSDLTGIDSTETTWGRAVQSRINTTVMAAVDSDAYKGEATFITPDFNGHELCSADPWVQGILARQPYHPTKQGQTAIAGQLRQVIQSDGDR